MLNKNLICHEDDYYVNYLRPKNIDQLHRRIYSIRNRKSLYKTQLDITNNSRNSSFSSYIKKSSFCMPCNIIY